MENQIELSHHEHKHSEIINSDSSMAGKFDENESLDQEDEEAQSELEMTDKWVVMCCCGSDGQLNHDEAIKF